MPIGPGVTLHNRYRVVRLLGQGGFGAVYRAWDLNLQRPCAIKENLETATESQEQFQREARMLSNLTHSNLPRVTDYFIIPNQGQYLVMDFIDGQDLQDMLDEAGEPLPEAQALTWIEQVSDALSYLHSQKPASSIAISSLKISLSIQTIKPSWLILASLRCSTLTSKPPSVPEPLRPDIPLSNNMDMAKPIIAPMFTPLAPRCTLC